MRCSVTVAMRVLGNVGCGEVVSYVVMLVRGMRMRGAVHWMSSMKSRHGGAVKHERHSGYEQEARNETTEMDSDSTQDIAPERGKILKEHQVLLIPPSLGSHYYGCTQHYALLPPRCI